MFDSASELARELNVDTKTIINWVEKGYIKTVFAKRRKYKGNYKISENQLKNCPRKDYKKQGKKWSQAELNFIIYDYERLGAERIAKIIGRSKNAVIVKRSILKKRDGYES